MQRIILAMAACAAMVSQAGQAWAGKDLGSVKARGTLICGVAKSAKELNLMAPRSVS